MAVHNPSFPTVAGSEPLSIERPVPGVAVVRLQREAKRNALDVSLMDALTAVAHGLADEPGLKAVVLTGGPSMFSAGVDVSVFDGVSAALDVVALRRMIAPGQRMIEAWGRMPQLTIAAVEGGAVGGGLGLVLACDWRVFAQDAWACVPEVKLGLTYGWGLLPRLSALVGPAKAKWMATLCRTHGCAELQQWGLVEQVAPPGQALACALALAQEVAALPAVAVQRVKKTVDAHSQTLLAAVTHSDAEEMMICLADAEGARIRALTLAALKDKGGA